MIRNDAGLSVGPRFHVPPVARIVVLVGLLGVIAFAVWALQGGLATSPDVPRIGTLAPNFSAQTVDGQIVSLSSYRGRPVILNFWATWCPPCRAEMPAISAVQRANPNAVVLAVDVMEGPVLVQRYLQEVSLGFTPVLDPLGETTGRYHVSSLPSSFFIGPDGTVRAMNVGPLDEPAIEANLRRAS